MVVLISTTVIPTTSSSSLVSSSKHHQPSFPTNHNYSRPTPTILALHAAEPAKQPQATATTSSPSTTTVGEGQGKWSLDSWKSKKALQLPEYPKKEELETVLRYILEDYPPIVFAGEARNLEERLGQAAMGIAFLLQGGDCAESFKEFNAVNIRDTFRVILQMSVVLAFGGQMPPVKVGRMAGQFAKPRSEPMEEKNGVKLPKHCERRYV
ncbi:hypothetical protein QN277_014938 [Acacia crassicarpa]|uniref:Phospho-2-dehydro-3-deoxyheptonate aldolase n=1 Tax=Acacia crassicarpa TaxID=499986 RepID=A0AAE1MV81_9FABA|nr:hypothetical protein QN277_014938 [Acacia crassicarpa]